MKIVPILILKKVAPVNSEVLVDLKNIESHDKGYFYPWGKLPRGKKEYD
jgi:hypothetical protein